MNLKIIFSLLSAKQYIRISATFTCSLASWLLAKAVLSLAFGATSGMTRFAESCL